MFIWPLVCRETLGNELEGTHEGELLPTLQYRNKIHTGNVNKACVLSRCRERAPFKCKFILITVLSVPAESKNSSFDYLPLWW